MVGTAIGPAAALAAIGVIMLAAAGCVVSAKSPTDDEGLLIRPAPIHNVEVLVAESYPPQAYVQIEGGLADSCTRRHSVTWTRQGETIAVAVKTQRPKDAVCAQVYGTFTERVSLGSDFVAGTDYTLKVNDLVQTFQVR